MANTFYLIVWSKDNIFQYAFQTDAYHVHPSARFEHQVKLPASARGSISMTLEPLISAVHQCDSEPSVAALSEAQRSRHQPPARRSVTHVLDILVAKWQELSAQRNQPISNFYRKTRRKPAISLSILL